MILYHDEALALQVIALDDALTKRNLRISDLFQTNGDYFLKWDNGPPINMGRNYKELMEGLRDELT